MDRETASLVKSITKNRKGVGLVTRICICGNDFTHVDDGTNSWDLCGSCKKNGREEVWKGGIYDNR